MGSMSWMLLYLFLFLHRNPSFVVFQKASLVLELSFSNLFCNCRFVSITESTQPLVLWMQMRSLSLFLRRSLKLSSVERWAYSQFMPVGSKFSILSSVFLFSSSHLLIAPRQLIHTLEWSYICFISYVIWHIHGRTLLLHATDIYTHINICLFLGFITHKIIKIVIIFYWLYCCWYLSSYKFVTLFERYYLPCTNLWCFQLTLLYKNPGSTGPIPRHAWVILSVY